MPRRVCLLRRKAHPCRGSPTATARKTPSDDAHAGRRALIDPCAGLPDYRRPFVRLALDERGEVLGGAADQLEALRVERRLDARVLEDRVDLGIEPGDDGFRRA